MSNFDEVEHKPLRDFNRTAFVYNLLEDAGQAPVEDYLSQFSEEDKKSIFTMAKAVKKLGVKRVRELVTQGVVFTEYPTEEEQVFIDMEKTLDEV